MERKLEQNILQKLKQRKLKRFWSRLVSVMMCVVVFCTTYALILPAITKEADTFCGVEEHMHTSDCYPEQGELICDLAHTEIHTHTEDCHPMTEALPSCGLDEVAAHKHTDACMAQDAKTLCCTIEETEGHAHTDACQPSEEKVLCCTVAETEGHVHTEACQPSEEKILCCTMEETEGHIHTDTCIQTEKVLICSPDETQEHVHEDSCYTDVASYICGMQEVAAHTHTDACYTVFVSYGCGMEEIAEHVHTDECYITTAISYGCGLEEAAAHTHGDACYTTADVCTLPETEGHTHSDSCYRTIYECGLDAQEHIHTESCYAPPALICELEEHEHTLACYSNPAADLESPSAWEATLPDTLTGIYTEDLLTVARSQLGYTESSRNYIVDDSGKLKGYTRYGDWYGIPHGDWCAMFASFCLHYAGVEEFPLEASCPKWEEILREKNLYKDPSEYIPKAADLIFFDWNENDILDHVGIVEEVVDTDVIVIEGNSNDCVEKNKYELHDSRIAGYGVLNGFQPPVIEDFVQPEGIVIPENADAWAVLVDPNRQVVQAPQTEPRDEPEAGTYGLRKTSDTQSLARAGTPLDLTPFINTVTMYDEFGNIIPSGSAVTEGDLVEFKIEYTVTGQQLGVMNGETVTVKSDTLTYKLPEIFEVIRDDSGDIVNSTGQKVGIYEINSTNGMITMSFTEDYVKQNANGIQIHGNISFFSTITKITDADNENKNY